MGRGYTGRMLSPDNYVQSPENSQGYNRYAYCYNNPLKFSDPDGDTPFLVIAAYFVVNAAIDYGMQVAFNYAAGYKGKDAWFNKVDFFDTVVSGGIGAITAGYGTAAKLAEKSGKTLSKFGTFVIKNPELMALGHTVVTSGADFTGEGWQPVSFDDFANRAVVSALTYYGSKELIKVGSSILNKRTTDATNNILEGKIRSLSDLSSLEGATWKEIEDLIPEDWVKGPLNKGEGIKFVNPSKKGEQILLEKGWIGAKELLHAGPYLKISRDGVVNRIPLSGNPILNK